MAQVEGIAQGVRVEQEGGAVVLRFVVQVTESERIPIEMRGKRVSGVLQDGDRVRLVSSGNSVRGSDGVARPGKVENLSTRSTVSVPGGGVIGGIASLVVSVGISVLSGILTAVLIALITEGSMGAAALPSGSATHSPTMESIYITPTQLAEGTHPASTQAPEGTRPARTQTPVGTPSATPGTSGAQSIPMLALLIGLVVTVFVFFVIYVRPRLR